MDHQRSAEDRRGEIEHRDPEHHRDHNSRQPEPEAMTTSKGRGIGRVPPESLFRLVRYIDRPEADMVFLSCTNLPTAEMLDDLEAEVGKPVISSNSATFWMSLRMAGINDSIEGFGRLLREC